MSITIGTSTVVGYTRLVNGNSGEEQLIITTSPSQSGKSPLLITRASVDGGAWVVLHEKWIPHKEIPKRIRLALASWCFDGIKATQKELQHNRLRINSIMRRYEEYYL